MGTGYQFVLAFDFVVLVWREQGVAGLAVTGHLNGCGSNL